MSNFGKNNETNYSTETNARPIYTADMLRDYRSELVEYIYEIHKSPSLEERWENAVKELVKELEIGKKL